MISIHINSDDPQGGWILERAARELESGIEQAKICKADGRINYAIPYKSDISTMHGVPVGLYTHRHNRNFDRSVAKHKYHIGMCKKTCELLRRAGAPDPIHIPLGTNYKKKVTFGVVGRTYGSGRKGEYLVENAVKAGFNVIAWGQGWPCKIVSDDYNSLEHFYRSLDYLIVSSLNEGGPMPVIEALALGVPVIAPDVGWCWEYPVIRYERGDWNSLFAVLRGLTETPTWEDFVSKHKRLFERILLHG